MRTHANLYQQLAFQITEQIDQGVLRPGERLPGVRRFSSSRGVSPSTVVAAYRKLEVDGYIEARDRSGFYVNARPKCELTEPEESSPSPIPAAVTGQELVLQLIQAIQVPGMVQLGAAVPAKELLPHQSVDKAMATIAQQHELRGRSYELPGALELRREVAKHLALAQCSVGVDDMVITGGCQQAIYLSLKLLTKPGDIVALESPTYYGLLQAVDSLGLKALEIPTHPRHGMSLDALQLAIEQWPIKVCIVTPNFSNPLGSAMSDEAKQQLVKMAEAADFMVIEDDIYGDLSFDHRRPTALKSFDCDERVVLCSSLSKTVSPGLRVGWVVNRRLRPLLTYQLFVTSCAASALSQLVLAKFMTSGGYQRHLKLMQTELATSAKKMIDAVGRYFPEETRITQPAGGSVLWLELPKTVDCVALTNRAYQSHISIAPGVIFSATGKYRNCIRMSFGFRWSDKIERALMQLGEMIHQQANKG